MSDRESNPQVSGPTLSDDTPVVEYFAIARVFQSQEKIAYVREALETIQDGDSTIVIDGDQLNELLPDNARLIPREVDALFTGLCLTGAAKEHTPAGSFIDYSFEVDIPAGKQVLDQQHIAASALEDARPTSDPAEIDLVATIPESVSLTAPDVVTYTSSRVRELLLNAQSSVRIANPYFDSEQTVVEDIASLPRRGVSTKLLTRETEDPDPQLRDTLNTLFQHLDARSRYHLDVRDLYETDPTTGRQQIATHAKMVVIDEKFCYIGSANLTYHSLLRNFEFGVLLSGEITETVATLFDDVFAHARQVDFPV